MLLKNGVVLHNDEFVEQDVLIEAGKIKALGTDLDAGSEEVVDLQGKLVTPGLIDVHVHLREPGFEHKETVESGTKAAARGGFTSISPMPNTNPIIDTVERLESLNDIIERDAHIKVRPYASITEGLKGEALADFEGLKKSGAFAFTDDGVGVQSADMMLRAMDNAAKLDMAIVAHTEENTLIRGGAIHDGKTSAKLGIPGIPAVTESVQIARDVLLAEAADCHYHVCHVSTKESVRVIRDAKRAGIRVTGEVTPHHLILNENHISEDDANFKMNPPLRAKEDQEALLEGLLDGTIDFIATDHAPHGEEEKAQGFLEAPFGISGLETAFSLLYTHLVKTNKIKLHQLIEWMTIKPAKTFGLPYGRLEENTAADMTVVDLNKTTVIDIKDFYSKGKNTPFHQWEVLGQPVLTIAEGNIVFQEDSNE